VKAPFSYPNNSDSISESGSAIHFDERLLRAGRVVVNDVGNQFLSRPRFATKSTVVLV